MATQFFNTLNKYYRNSTEFSKQVEVARTWFRSAALRLNDVTPEMLMKNKGPLGAQPGGASRKRLVPTAGLSTQMIGRMCLFFYDAKTKDKLPYWDRFPMIFPFRIKKDRFWGINLHYLPYQLRAKLMDALHNEVFKGKELDESVRLRLTYKILQKASAIPYYKPCIKQYLVSHVKSRFNFVDPKEWNFVLMLPLERFEKAGTAKVWEDSKKKIGL
jgi:hypothetical protein